MPEALSTHPDPYRHSFPNGDVFTGWSYPPKEYDKWSALVTAWVKHLDERYGDTAGKSWVGEDVTAAAIQKVLPEAKIGGPEATGVGPGKSEAMLRQFLEHCAHGTNAATGK